MLALFNLFDIDKCCCKMVILFAGKETETKLIKDRVFFTNWNQVRRFWNCLSNKHEIPEHSRVIFSLSNKKKDSCAVVVWKLAGEDKQTAVLYVFFKYFSNYSVLCMFCKLIAGITRKDIFSIVLKTSPKLRYPCSLKTFPHLTYVTPWSFFS